MQDKLNWFQGQTMSFQSLPHHFVGKCINYNVSDGFIHDDKREFRLGSRAGGLKAGQDIWRRRYVVYTFRKDSHATELPIRHNYFLGVDLTELPCKETRCFVTGMLERCRLNLTTKADLVAILDEATNVVRETHTRDTGCVEGMIKEKEVNRGREVKIVTTIHEKQKVWVLQLHFNKLLRQWIHFGDC
jgi:hypothetical protein